MRATADFTFSIYMSLKLHFGASSYRLRKYGDHWGYLKKIREYFSQRKDKGIFEELSKKHKTEKELMSFMIPNFFENPDLYAAELLNEQAFQIHTIWAGRLLRMSEIFKQDIKVCLDDKSWDTAFYKVLGHNVMNGVISPETYIIFSTIFPDLAKKNLDDNTTFCYIIGNRLKSYGQLIEIDEKKYKKIWFEEARK